MGFGWDTRTAYDVQRDNGKRFDFAKIKEHYESVKPINSKQRKHLNVRPIGERTRSQERMVKVSDNEYYITHDAWCWTEINRQGSYKHSRAITFSLNGDMETITVHTPYFTFNDGSVRVRPSTFSAPSTFYFYDFNLPVGLDMANINSCKYICLHTEKEGFKYYTVERGDITFTRKVGAQYWIPMVVHREVTHQLDRTRTKELRKRAQPLLEYLNVMVDMVEPKYLYDQNQSVRRMLANLIESGETEASNDWFLIAEVYKKRIESWKWSSQRYYDKSRLAPILYKDLYLHFKPFKQNGVPLGRPCKDRYKSWL